MSTPPTTSAARKQSILISIAVFILGVGGMAYLRLYLFQDRFVTLTYGLPLLLCLWHRNRRLLWLMAVAFMAMAYYKAFHLLPDVDPTDRWELTQWFFQCVNILITAGAVDAINHFTEVLRVKNKALAEANEELKAQSEELAQQNEEIQGQGEELAQQNEELNRQAEELQQQNEELERQGEELQAQSEELKAANDELTDRETMLGTLLQTIVVKDRAQPVLDRICEMALSLMGRAATCAAVVEQQGDELFIRSQRGITGLERDRWPLNNSLAVVAMQHARTAAVHDLRERPDLIVPRSADVQIRSSLVTPLRVGGQIIGVMEIHSAEPQAWTTRQFRLIEWAAAQCGLLLEIIQLRDELAHKNAHLEQIVRERTEKLQELVNELEHFSYSITHDMRAPLRALQGFAGILMEECQSKLSPTHADYLGRIMQSAGRMDCLITDALSYSHAVRTEQPLQRVDTGRLLNGILASYPAFQPPEARVEIRGPLPPVLGNEAGLTQVFSNLIGNAVKFVPPGQQPHVTISAETQDGIVRLWVEDNGIGIPEQFQPRLFGMFQRLNKGYDGTGIGLALVRKVCERMSGKVGVQSQPGHGSRFWVELKGAEPQGVEHRKVSAS